MSTVVRTIKRTWVYQSMKKMKKHLQNIYYRFAYNRLPLHIGILGLEESIIKIRDARMSCVRFGDGEIKYLHGKNIVYQEQDDELKKSLRDLLKLEDAGLLVCLPDTFDNLNKYIVKSQHHWRKHIVTYKRTYLDICNGRQYGNAFLSRPYMIYKDKTVAKRRFELLKSLWDGRKIVLVEGVLSRSGVGNDLFDNTISIERIICPSENAFERFKDILGETVKVGTDRLTLLALGPTAKPLVYELYKKGYQALDIGHIDPEYEWFLAGATTKIRLHNKHAAEILDDDRIGECEDEEYWNQIIATIPSNE